MSELVPGTEREKAARAKGVLARYQPQVEVMSPAGAASPEHLLALAYFAISKEPKLAEATGQSVVAAVLESVSLGLEIGVNGQAWLVPFRNNRLGAFEATLIVGYRGFLRLAYRSPEIAVVDAQVVREGDEFDYQLGTDPKIVHRKKEGSKYGEVTHAYCWAELIRGGKPVIEVMDIGDLERVRKISKMKDSGAWRDHTEEMYRKCPIRRIFKRLPVLESAQRASDLDDAADRGDQGTKLLQGRILLPELAPIATLATPEEEAAALSGELVGQGLPGQHAGEQAAEGLGDTPAGDQPVQGNLGGLGSTPLASGTICETPDCERVAVGRWGESFVVACEVCGPELGPIQP